MAENKALDGTENELPSLGVVRSAGSERGVTAEGHLSGSKIEGYEGSPRN